MVFALLPGPDLYVIVIVNQTKSVLTEPVKVFAEYLKFRMGNTVIYPTWYAIQKQNNGDAMGYAFLLGREVYATAIVSQMNNVLMDPVFPFLLVRDKKSFQMDSIVPLTIWFAIRIVSHGDAMGYVFFHGRENYATVIVPQMKIV